MTTTTTTHRCMESSVLRFGQYWSMRELLVPSQAGGVRSMLKEHGLFFGLGSGDELVRVMKESGTCAFARACDGNGDVVLETVCRGPGLLSVNHGARGRRVNMGGVDAGDYTCHIFLWIRPLTQAAHAALAHGMPSLGRLVELDCGVRIGFAGMQLVRARSLPRSVGWVRRAMLRLACGEGAETMVEVDGADGPDLYVKAKDI